MTRQTAARLAWGLWAATAALGLVLPVILLPFTDASLRDVATTRDIANGIAAILAFQSFATVGAIVASRHPENAVGWILCLAAFACQLGNAAGVFAGYAYSNSVPGAVAASIAFGPSWIVGVFVGVILVLFLFPDGTPVSRRWRPVVAAAVCWIPLMWVASMLQPGTLELMAKEQVDNPIGVTALDGADGFMLLVMFPFLCLAIVSLALRYRRASGDERQQIKIFVVTAVVVVVGLFVLTMDGIFPLRQLLGPASDVVFLLLVALIPISMGVAILRYRLYDVDRVISRTLVYGSLTAVLAAAYIGLVLLGQWVFSSFAGGSNLAIAVSTLVVAALFLPVRSRVQRFVDRRFYRRRYDARRTLEGFGARLREQIDLGTLRIELHDVVEETMQPAHVGLWLRTEEGR